MRFGSGDREIVSGKPHWQADVDVARRRLFERGLVDRGSSDCVWILAKAAVEQPVLRPEARKSSWGVAERGSQSIRVPEPAGERALDAVTGREQRGVRRAPVGPGGDRSQ